MHQNLAVILWQLCYGKISFIVLVQLVVVVILVRVVAVRVVAVRVVAVRVVAVAVGGKSKCDIARDLLFRKKRKRD